MRATIDTENETLRVTEYTVETAPEALLAIAQQLELAKLLWPASLKDIKITGQTSNPVDESTKTAG